MCRLTMACCHVVGEDGAFVSRCPHSQSVAGSSALSADWGHSKAGEPRKTPKDRPLRGINQETYWYTVVAGGHMPLDARWRATWGESAAKIGAARCDCLLRRSGRSSAGREFPTRHTSHNPAL